MISTTAPSIEEIGAYESLIADILVTRSLLFSIVGLGGEGREWMRRLPEDGFATVGIETQSDQAYREPMASSMVRVSAELEDIRGADVVIDTRGFPCERTLVPLLPHVKRGQVLCFITQKQAEPACVTSLAESLKLSGRQLGHDVFVVQRPPLGRADAVCPSGLTPACTRIATALETHVFSKLA